MNDGEALRAIEDLLAKGWSFDLHADAEGWTCGVIGLGLAHAECEGKSLAEAVDLALGQARAMEDDPGIVVARHESWIRRNVEEVFGEGSFRGIQVVERIHESGPKRLEVAVAARFDVEGMVDREMEFWHRLSGQDREILDPLGLKILWPEETAQGVGKE